MELVIRYRKGTQRHVPLNLLAQLKENLGLVHLSKQERYKRVHSIKDALGWRISVEATWKQFLSELVEEFERTSDGKDESWRPVLGQYVQFICQDKTACEVWPQLRDYIYNNVEMFSGWRWNHRRFPLLHGIYRKDGQYFTMEKDKEIRVLGAKTMLEEQWDYYSHSITGERGLLHLCLKVFALTNIQRLSHLNADIFPQSVKIVLGESDHSTHFLHWRWEVKWPYEMRPLNWRPDNNYCDPNWLSADLATYISEKEKLEVEPGFATADPSLVQKWTEAFGKATQMYSFALETDLCIGDNLETWIDFRGHKYRWVNGTASSYPVLIATYADGETNVDVELRSFKAMSHFSFVFDRKIEIDGWVGSINRYNPAISNPRRRNFFEVVPEGYFQEVKGKNQEHLDFALSLYREGMSSSSPFYRFLNFYKIIQFAFHEKPSKITSWIESNAPSLFSFNNDHFQRDFSAFGGTVTSYLYEANRNAIAHVNLASGKEVVDPDNVLHLRRVNSALYLIKDLAQEAIKSGQF